MRYIFIGILAYFLLCGITFSINRPITEPQQGWTIQTLKEHYDYVLKERDEKILQKFESLELAITKQETAYKDKFANTNEWRASYEDLIRQMQVLIQTMQRDYVPRTEYVSLEKQFAEQKALKQGGNIVWAYVLGGVSLIIGIISIKDRLIKKV